MEGRGVCVHTSHLDVPRCSSLQVLASVGYIVLRDAGSRRRCRGHDIALVSGISDKTPIENHWWRRHDASSESIGMNSICCLHKLARCLGTMGDQECGPAHECFMRNKERVINQL